MANTIGGGANAAYATNAIPVEQAAIQVLLNSLNSALAHIQCAQGRFDTAADRLCGSRPEPVGKDAAAPIPNSVEARLREAVGMAEMLGNCLHNVADRFDKAI